MFIKKWNKGKQVAINLGTINQEKLVNTFKKISNNDKSISKIFPKHLNEIMNESDMFSENYVSI